MEISSRLKDWLEHDCGLKVTTVVPLRHDAGLRRYFRVFDGCRSLVAVDAVLDKNSCLPFIEISACLRNLGLHTPEIINSNTQLGYMLVTDFGDTLLLSKLIEATADELYERAMTDLLTIQLCKIDKVPNFSIKIMQQELIFFTEWFLEGYLGLSLSFKTQQMLRNTYLFLSETAASQPQVFIHRDYHSQNLMVLPGKVIGIIDFQDACIGPITYDLVSLLRDCYISWPDEKVDGWINFWYEKSAYKNLFSFDEVKYWFDLMGVQRHLKAAMIFARKFLRDQDERYLQHIPRTLNYIFKIMPKYSALAGLNVFLLEKAVQKCEV